MASITEQINGLIYSELEGKLALISNKFGIPLCELMDYLYECKKNNFEKENMEIVKTSENIEIKNKEKKTEKSPSKKLIQSVIELDIDINDEELLEESYCY